MTRRLACRSSNGRFFDIGNTTRSRLERFRRTIPHLGVVDDDD